MWVKLPACYGRLGFFFSHSYALNKEVKEITLIILVYLRGVL